MAMLQLIKLRGIKSIATFAMQKVAVLTEMECLPMNHRLLKACVSFAMVCFCQQAVMAELKIDLNGSRNLRRPNATNSERIALVGNNLEKLLGSTKSEAAELLGQPLEVFKEDIVYLRLTTNISQFESVARSTVLI